MLLLKESIGLKIQVQLIQRRIMMERIILVQLGQLQLELIMLKLQGFHLSLEDLGLSLLLQQLLCQLN